ncbi:MAG: hypothetical protein IJO67_02270 [Clostridia bacterium]|nr:hypothetical protein [Clostridia bacterium]
MHSSDDAIRVEGNGNVLMNNIADHSVHIRGRGNQVIGLAFTSPEGKLILEGEAAESTYITGVDEGRIIRR